MKTMQDIVDFAQANLAAVTDAVRIFSAGVQNLSQQAYAAGHAQLADGITHLQSLSGVTSMERVVELQSRAVRESLQSGLAETGKLAGAALQLIEQTAAPLTLQADAAMRAFVPYV